MAKKTRKQKQRAAIRRPGPSVAPPTDTAPSGVAVEAEDLQPAATAGEPTRDVVVAEPARRRVERLNPSTTTSATAAAAVPRSRPVRGQAAGYIQPLDSDEAAIPFDRVPYVPADLRRVAVIAVVMILLIIVADIVVSNVVK